MTKRVQNGRMTFVSFFFRDAPLVVQKFAATPYQTKFRLSRFTTNQAIIPLTHATWLVKGPAQQDVLLDAAHLHKHHPFEQLCPDGGPSTAALLSVESSALVSAQNIAVQLNHLKKKQRKERAAARRMMKMQ